MKKVRYTCSHCGKRVVLGEHYCPKSPLAVYDREDPPVESDDTSSDNIQTDNTPADSTQSDNTPETINWQLIGGVTAAVLVIALLWSSLGPLSLVVLPAVAVAVGLGSLAKYLLSGLYGPAYRELLQLVGDQADVAKRLIDAEKKKNPEISRQKCIERVLDQIRYERMR